MKIIVLLAGMTRGGIDLLQSLFDKHSQISQFPGKFYVDDFLKKTSSEKNPENISNIFLREYPEYFNSKLNIIEKHNKLGKNKDESYCIDKNIFIKKFKDLSRDKILTNKEIIINLHLAYSAASGENIDKKKLIILQIHHFFRIESISDLDFDIICTIRDPLASHSSYIKNLSIFRSDYINPWQYNYHMERNFTHLIKLCNLNKKVNVIKLERLHKKNYEVMNKICQIYELNFENTLQMSTFHGKLWWGDQVSKKDLNGINKNFTSNIDLNIFYKNDIEIIEYYLENFIRSYNYPFKGKQKKNLFFKKFFPLKADVIIITQSLKKLSFKNLLLSLYYFFKRTKYMNKKILDEFEYPKDI